MVTSQLPNKDLHKDCVEIVMVDGMGLKKSILLCFNLSDEWRKEEMFNNDVPGMFASGIMEICRKV